MFSSLRAIVNCCEHDIHASIESDNQFHVYTFQLFVQM
jgi:hypothetical protein